MSAWIDWVAAFIVQLNVVVCFGFTVAFRQGLIRLRSGELYVLVGLGDLFSRLESRPSLDSHVSHVNARCSRPVTVWE